MKDNKRIRELVPIVALLLFIIAVLVLCVVSARGKRAEQETSAETAAESTETLTEETQGVTRSAYLNKIHDFRSQHLHGLNLHV